MEVVRTLADLDPAAVWLGWAVIGLLAVLVGYVGLVLVAALKAHPGVAALPFGAAP